jgi:hypothetical protein
VIQRIVPKAGNEFTQEKIDHLRGKESQKLDPALGAIFKNSKRFQRTKQKLHIYFSLEQSRLKI